MGLAKKNFEQIYSLERPKHEIIEKQCCWLKCYFIWQQLKLKTCSYFSEKDKQYAFSDWTLPAFLPLRQIWNIEWLQYRLKSELSDDIKVCCLWLDNLSVYAGDLDIFCN